LPGGDAIGNMTVEVVRRTYINVDPDGLPEWQPDEELESNAVELNVSGNRVFVSLGTDEIAVLDGDSSSPNFNAIQAYVGVGEDDVSDLPSSLAITPDNTRVYVTLENTHDIAVVDALALVELDPEAIQGSETPADIIVPPGAEPNSIIMDPSGRFAYLLDNVANGNTSVIYVVDTDPASKT
jgi:DNA-binding beta-propeller fold protein YncE